MSKRKQNCDGCGYQIRHGYPRWRLLFCSYPCMQANGHKTGKWGTKKPVSTDG